jgi:hypothetical protein
MALLKAPVVMPAFSARLKESCLLQASVVRRGLSPSFVETARPTEFFAAGSRAISKQQIMRVEPTLKRG